MFKCTLIAVVTSIITLESYLAQTILIPGIMTTTANNNNNNAVSTAINTHPITSFLTGGNNHDASPSTSFLTVGHNEASPSHANPITSFLTTGQQALMNAVGTVTSNIHNPQRAELKAFYRVCTKLRINQRDHGKDPQGVPVYNPPQLSTIFTSGILPKKLLNHWNHTISEMAAKYQSSFQSLAGPDLVAFLDVTCPRKLNRRQMIMERKTWKPLSPDEIARKKTIRKTCKNVRSGKNDGSGLIAPNMLWDLSSPMLRSFLNLASGSGSSSNSTDGSPLQNLGREAKRFTSLLTALAGVNNLDYSSELKSQSSSPESLLAFQKSLLNRLNMAWSSEQIGQFWNAYCNVSHVLKGRIMGGGSSTTTSSSSPSLHESNSNRVASGDMFVSPPAAAPGSNNASFSQQQQLTSGRSVSSAISFLPSVAYSSGMALLSVSLTFTLFL